MHIHIIGIAGSMTAPLAVALKKQGHVITGSDQQKIYPPFSNQLKKAGIEINCTPIDSHINLAIIGSSYASFSKTKQDFEQIKQQNIPYISATDYISKNLIKENSILVAGSYGKTTITAALSYLLTKASYNPSYMFGGLSINKIESLHLSNSNWSVTEADESINGLDTQAKFLYYPVKYLILTSANWEHKESYKSELDNFSAFKKLIDNLPSDGLLIYNPNDPTITPLLKFAKCKTIAYQPTKLPNNLIGCHNLDNLGSVETIANYLQISPTIISKSFLTFRGIKRRLELIADKKGIKFIDDFAQSGNRIYATLNALKEMYPQSKIKVFYENHASFMQYRSNLEDLSKAFKLADEVVIYKLNFNSKISEDNRLCAKDFLKNIPNSVYLPMDSDIINYFLKSLKSGDILIRFSSGGSIGLKTYKKIISLFSN